MTYIHGIPTPSPSTSPTIIAVPMVSLSTARLNSPVNMASNIMNAIMVASMSVIADSKLIMDLAPSETRTFRTSPNTMTELLPPTIVPSSMLSISHHPAQ